MAYIGAKHQIGLIIVLGHLIAAITGIGVAKAANEVQAAYLVGSLISFINL